MSNNRNDRLADLSRLAGLVKDRDLSKVRRIVAHMNRLQAEISSIQADQDARRDDPALDPSRLSGADVVWQARGDAQLARHQAQMATLRITHEAALRDSRKAFGRADVLTRLSDAMKTGGR